MIEMLVARHGQTDLNQRQGFQGHVDTLLNDIGLDQANTLRKMIRCFSVDAVYSSDLKRAFDTATIATRRVVKIDNRLREQNFGVLDGLDGTSSREEHPAAYQLWRQSDAYTRLFGGESVYDVVLRVQSFLFELNRSQNLRRIFIVTHGGVLECMRAIALEMEFRRFAGTDHNHGGLSLFRLTNRGLKLVAWNGVLSTYSRQINQ